MRQVEIPGHLKVEQGAEQLRRDEHVRPVQRARRVRRPPQVVSGPDGRVGAQLDAAALDERQLAGQVDERVRGAVEGVRGDPAELGVAEPRGEALRASRALGDGRLSKHGPVPPQPGREALRTAAVYN